MRAAAAEGWEARNGPSRPSLRRCPHGRTAAADGALFAIGTADLGGGRVCIVDIEADVDTASCNTPAWGTPNQIVAVGTFIQPIEGPFLRTGIWRRFGEGDCLKLIRDYCVTPAAATSWRT